MADNPIFEAVVEGEEPLKQRFREAFMDLVMVFANVAAVQATDTRGQKGIHIGGDNWLYDSTDTTTPDDGVSCIIDLSGTRRFKKVSAGPPLGMWDFWQEAWISNATATALDGFTGAAVSSGTNNTALPAAALLGYNPHGVFIRSGTTANGGYLYRTSSLTSDFFGVTARKFRCRFLWRTAFTGRTVRIGFHDTATIADATDGAYFEIAADICMAKTASNSTRTTHVTTLTLALNTPYTFEIDVNAAGTEARFRVFEARNETALMDVTITTNIPATSARAFGAGLVATEATTTASDIGVLYSLGFGTIPGFQRATGRS